uniref:Uncharacterized protein n=1 Tax=Heterorhabditis bacteriophora TaxID=37862 RepID=A0A1I7WTZ5_HETBA
MILTPVIIEIIKKFTWFKKNPKLNVPIQLLLTFVLKNNHTVNMTNNNSIAILLAITFIREQGMPQILKYNFTCNKKHC